MVRFSAVGDLPQVYFVNQKIGKGKSGTLITDFSGSLITNDEIDLGQVYGCGEFNFLDFS